MEQGSTLDSKQGFDFADGDWSERTEPRGDWCPNHGYYGPCPECTGLVEFIATNVSEAAPPVWPWTPKEQWFVPDVGARVAAAAGAAPLVARARALDHVPIGTNPGLLARVKLALGRTLGEGS